MRRVEPRLRPQAGASLVVGLILLSLVTVLGLAGAGSAHVEQALAHNERFRENAAAAASAGIEFAITRIVNTTVPETAAGRASHTLSGTGERIDTDTRFLGYELALPQEAGANLAGAHFEITATGYGARRAEDRQRATVMLVVSAATGGGSLECAPATPRPCHRRGDLVRLSWQRLPPE
jgi:hypothetical protein